MGNIVDITMQDIADALYKAGLLNEYAAMKGYMVERSALFEKLRSIETYGHNAGDKIAL